jgi:AcrR family transcriptional regulator
MAKRAQVRLRLDVDSRREQLLELGLRAFSEKPYDEVSIDELAKAAGVSKGLLYHYFPTKRDLYVVGLERAAEQLLASTETPPELAGPERLRRGLEAYLAFVERHGPAYVALLQGGIGSDAGVSSILDRTRATFIDRILEGLPPAGRAAPLLRTALRGWIGFVEATAVEWLGRRQRGSEQGQVVDLLLGVLLAALQAIGLAAPG